MVSGWIDRHVDIETHHEDRKERLEKLVISGECVQHILVACEVHKNRDGVF